MLAASGASGCCPLAAAKRASWVAALLAALAIASALLIKQSALLVLLGPALWAVVGLQERRRRWQLLASFGLVLALVAPGWVHNLITAIGGTNRATLESAAREGDPNAHPWRAGWYPRRLPGLIGQIPLIGGLAGAVLAARRLRWPRGWGLAVGVFLSGWLLTTLSPNKDPRYLAPLLLCWRCCWLGAGCCSGLWCPKAYAVLSFGLSLRDHRLLQLAGQGEGDSSGTGFPSTPIPDC